MDREFEAPAQSAFDRLCPLYRNLPANELARLSALARLQRVAEQQYLCRQDSPHDRVFNLVTGAAAVERLSSSGRRQILAFVFPGDIIGLANADRFGYGVKSLMPTTFHEFPQRGLFALSEELPGLKSNIRQLQSLVLALTFDQLYLLGQKKAQEKICTFLLQLLERLPGASRDCIDLPMTRLDIADYLGLTPETVIRTLARLRASGILSMPSPQSVCIHDMQQVRSLGDVH